MRRRLWRWIIHSFIHSFNSGNNGPYDRRNKRQLKKRQDRDRSQYDYTKNKLLKYTKYSNNIVDSMGQAQTCMSVQTECSVRSNKLRQHKLTDTNRRRQLWRSHWSFLVRCSLHTCRVQHRRSPRHWSIVIRHASDWRVLRVQSDRRGTSEHEVEYCHQRDTQYAPLSQAAASRSQELARISAVLLPDTSTTNNT